MVFCTANLQGSSRGQVCLSAGEHTRYYYRLRVQGGAKMECLEHEHRHGHVRIAVLAGDNTKHGL
jgi:hypothetical protein